MFALETQKVQCDRLCLLGGVDHFYDDLTGVLIEDTAGEKTVLSFLTGHKLLVHGRGQHMGTFVRRIHLLHVVAARLEHTGVIVPDEIGTPLPTLNMCEEWGIGCHIDHVGIALQIGHETSLKDRGLIVVPFLAFSMTGIFSGKDLRPLAVVVLVAQTTAIVAVSGFAGCITKEPVFVTVEMLVDEVGLLFPHSLPTFLEHLAFGVGTAGAHNLDMGVFGADGRNERFQTLVIHIVPLLIAHTDVFHVEWFRVPHLSTLLSPF